MSDSTLIDVWLAEAVAKGKALGKAEAKAEANAVALALVLTDRFGPLSTRDQKRLAAAAHLGARALKAALRAKSRIAFFEWVAGASKPTAKRSAHR